MSNNELVPKSPIWTTGQVYDGLDVLFASPAYSTLREVPDGTGMNKRRTADALVMSLWESRGIHLTGIEIKASRSDWAKELASPAKADAIARYCDFWYLAVGSESIISTGELPESWGLIAPRRGKLAIVKKAPRFADPAPISRAFLASLFRRTVERLAQDDPVRLAREAGLKAGFEAGERSAKASASSDAHRYKNSFESLKTSVDAFHAASGVRIDHWNGKELGEAVRLIMDGGMLGLINGMENLSRQAAIIASKADRIANDARLYKLKNEEVI